MTTIRPRRSALYMPASNVRAIEKARSLPCDVVILDLEDSVAPEMKAEARDNALAAAKAGGFGARELILRVNAIETPWGADDLKAATQAPFDGVLAPKVGDAFTATHYGEALAAAPDLALWAMIETTRAIFRLDEIAAALAARKGCFVIGTNDLAKEMGAKLTVERQPFLGFMALAVAAAKGYGLGALDGVFNAIEDDAGLERQCAEARSFGFDGKTLIHPRQIDFTNRAFSPSGEDVAWAEAVIAGFALPENGDKGAIRIGKEMVERLHIAEARKIIAATGRER